MAARFAVVSGRSNGRGKCENLEKIAFRKRKKSYEIWFIKIEGQILNFTCFIWIRIGFVDGDTPPCVKSKLCKQTIFCENRNFKKYFRLNIKL